MDAINWREDGFRHKLTWDGLETLSLDRCLRLLAWSYAGKLYRRGLDGAILEIEREEHHASSFTPRDDWG